IVSAPGELGAWIGDPARPPPVSQLLHQLALLGGEVGGGEDAQFVEQVAGRFLAPGRQPLAAQTHHAAGLTVGRDLQRDPAVRRRRGDFGAERRLIIPDRQAAADIAAVEREAGTGLDANRHDQVAVEFGARRLAALALQPQPRVVGHPGRDRDLERAPRPDRATPATGLARLGGMNDAGLAASLRLGAETGAAAGGALILGEHFEPPIPAAHGVVQRDRGRRFEVVGPCGASSRAAVETLEVEVLIAGAATAAAEETLEEIAEGARVRRFEASWSGSTTRPRIAAQDFVLGRPALPIGAEFVILLALIGVAENLVGLIDLLEALLAVLVVGIDVGMVFAGELAVRAFDFGRRRAALDTQDFIIVAKFHE